MIQVKIFSLALDSFTKAPIVILTDLKEKKCLPIWIGIFEANSIMIAINNIQITRPLTHDLMIDLISKLGGALESIYITSVKDGVYYAEIQLRREEEVIKIDARPSDSIALAVRKQVPIFISKELEMSMVGLDEFRSKIVDEHLKSILDNLKEDDFGKYKM
ncbi:MAG TPA: bifunctional nuclease family protein [Firmicutes bacterium]|nr:bifunctional nuclease family protein [Bacillota bacterium]